MEDKLCWVRFQRVFGYGTTRGHKLLSHFGHPGRIFEQDRKQLAKSGVFTPGELRRLGDDSLEEAARKALDFCEDHGCAVLTPDDPEYPQRLREIYACPAALYVRGSLAGLDEDLAIAMVGTRSCTDYGRRAAETISRELAAKGAVIVSGLARGIDTLCHIAALRAGGRTMAVLGCGIDVVYPPENRELEELIVRYGGAVVTEFQPGEAPLAFHFPIRNRIISGLCCGTVVVEGTLHSGSLITAGHAMAQNRDLFAVPGSIFSSSSQGPNRLLGQGAKPVEGMESILEEYQDLLRWEDPPNPAEAQRQIPTLEEFEESGQKGYNGEQRPKQGPKGNIRPGRGKDKDAGPRQQTLPPYLNETQQKVFGVLSDGEVRTADYISAQCGLPVHKVLAALTQMEIFDMVRPHPGKRYSL